MINVRKMAEGDYPQLLELWENTPEINIAYWDQPKPFSRFVNKNKDISYVAEKDGQLIGSLLCGFDGRHCYIYHCAVLREHQRKGIGQKLLNACLGKLKQLKIKAVHLIVAKNNEPAIAFWQRGGFIARKNVHMLTRIVK